MSDFDIIPSDGGDLQPYAPTAPLLPSPDSGWLVPQPEADYLTEYQTGSVPRFFGQPAPDFTPQQLNQVVNEIADLFSADTVWQRGDRAFVTAVADWYRQNAFAPAPREYVQHHYNLRGFSFPPNDQPIVTAFLNYCSEIGATQKQVKTSLVWYGELLRRVNQAQQPQPQSRQMGATVDQLSDAEFAVVERRCESDRQRAEMELRAKWQWQFETNLELVSSYVRGLPRAEREYLLNAVAAGGEMLMNNAAVIERLYQQAVSGARVPNVPAGATLQQEIAAIEDLMKRNRRAYNADVALQNKLRDLYRQRDG